MGTENRACLRALALVNPETAEEKAISRIFGPYGIGQSLAEHSFGAAASRIAERKSQWWPRGIDGSKRIAPTALHPNVCLIETPGVGRRLKMTAKASIQFRAVASHPLPDGRVVSLHTALSEQLFQIKERERVAKTLAHATTYEPWLRLPQLEQRRSDYLLHSQFGLPPLPDKVAARPESLNPTQLQHVRGKRS